MNIGVSMIGGSDSNETINKCLRAWDLLRLFDADLNIKISVAMGTFPEVAALETKSDNHEKSLKMFKALYKADLIQNFIHSSEPMYEANLRNLTLPYLKSAFGEEKMTALWLLDVDEIYKEEEILTILETVKRHNFIEWFRVKFINHIKFKGRLGTYKNFQVPRIWRNDKNGGVDSFFYDNDIIFNNGKKASDLPCMTISSPEVTHLSWVGSDEYLKRKVEFANKHYKTCSFIFGSEGLDFNKEYYLKTGKEMPEITYLD